MGGPVGRPPGRSGDEAVRPTRTSGPNGPRPGRRPQRSTRRRSPPPPGDDGQEPTLRLPPALPTVPTLVVAGLAVVLAFVVGNATGGDDAGTSVDASAAVTTRAGGPTTHAVREHTVVAGETLYSIAAKYHVTGQQLAEVNGIVNLNLVQVGQVLKIPPSTTTTTSTTTTLPPTTRAKQTPTNTGG